jgi:hypothetical protein
MEMVAQLLMETSIFDVCCRARSWRFSNTDPGQHATAELGKGIGEPNFLVKTERFGKAGDMRYSTWSFFDALP